MLKNKYSKWYKNLITKARKRIPIEGEYYEKHHIKPRSLGGSNSKRNIVKLTAKEHFLLHLLLTKSTIGKEKRKMRYALLMMTNRILKNGVDVNPKINSFLYIKIRETNSKELCGEGNPFYGKKHSKKTIKMFKETRKGKDNPRYGKHGCRGKINGMYGKTHTLKVRKKLSKLKKIQYLGANNPFYGKKHSKKTIEKIVKKLCTTIYKVTFPNGRTQLIKNIKGFARQHGLSDSVCYDVLYGRSKQGHHKGFKFKVIIRKK